MQDFEPVAKKGIKCKKYLKVIRVLKKLIRDTKRIFDLEVKLTVSKLLASALVVEKQITKAIITDKKVQFKENILDLDKVDKIKKLLL